MLRSLCARPSFCAFSGRHSQISLAVAYPGSRPQSTCTGSIPGPDAVIPFPLYQQLQGKNEQLHGKNEQLHEKNEQLHEKLAREMKEMLRSQDERHDKVSREMKELYEKTENYSKEMLRSQDERHDKVSREMKELHEKTENYIFQVANLKVDLLQAIDDKLRVTGNFNVRGALERIASQAPQERDVPREGGTHQKLIALARLPEFMDIAKKVSKERGIRFEDLMACTKHIYHEHSKHAHGNDSIITIRAKNYTPGEVGALVTYLKLQEKWPYALTWKLEEENGKEP